MLSNLDKNYIIKHQGSQTQDFYNYLTSPKIKDNILSPVLMEISDKLDLDTLDKFRLAAFDDLILNCLLIELNDKKELPNKVNFIVYYCLEKSKELLLPVNYLFFEALISMYELKAKFYPQPNERIVPWVNSRFESLVRHANPEKSNKFYNSYLLAGVLMSDNTVTQIKKLEAAILDGEECLRQVEEDKLNNKNPHMTFIFDHGISSIQNNINHWQKLLESSSTPLHLKVVDDTLFC